jgi:hypothetical protein
LKLKIRKEMEKSKPMSGMLTSSLPDVGVEVPSQ